VTAHKHRWNGWPGAFCLKCGAEDPQEIAISQEWWDEDTGWCCEGHRKLVERANECKVSDDEWKAEQEQRRERGERAVQCSEQAAKRIIVQAQPRSDAQRRG
jgi:hypothetical protein